jgi:non-ribosomal peptide synthetase component E (peptide arylation enzyme)
MNCENFLSALAARNPRKTAVVFANERISDEQLEHSSAFLAGWLLQQGRKPKHEFDIHWPTLTELVKLLFEEMLQANEWLLARVVAIITLIICVWKFRKRPSNRTVER